MSQSRTVSMKNRRSVRILLLSFGQCSVLMWLNVTTNLGKVTAMPIRSAAFFLYLCHMWGGRRVRRSLCCSSLVNLCWYLSAMAAHQSKELCSSLSWSSTRMAPLWSPFFLHSASVSARFANKNFFFYFRLILGYVHQCFVQVFKGGSVAESCQGICFPGKGEEENLQLFFCSICF